MPKCHIGLCGLLLVLPACGGKSAAGIDAVALTEDKDGANWAAFGRTYSEQRFSPLTQINASNVAQLKPDWFLDLPEDRALVSTPLVANGVLYFVGSLNVVRAVDATTGAIKWRYDPKVMERAGGRIRAGWDHSRGIALWGGRVFVATWDGWLIGIDAATG